MILYPQPIGVFTLKDRSFNSPFSVSFGLSLASALREYYGPELPGEVLKCRVLGHIWPADSGHRQSKKLPR